ncbi:MAG: hypothetical protein IJ124_06040 [Clostridia bacterium]|nr:hypothetical protein [Clostridia bacterium]
MAIKYRLFSGELRGQPGDDQPFWFKYGGQHMIYGLDGQEYGFDIPAPGHSYTVSAETLFVVVELAEGLEGYLGSIKFIYNETPGPNTEWIGPFPLYQPPPDDPYAREDVSSLRLVSQWTDDTGNALRNYLQIGLDTAPTAIFVNSAIQEIGGVFSADCIGDTLPWDELTATVQYGNPDAPNYNPYGPDIKALPYGTPIKWVHDETRVVRLYLTGVERVAKYLYRVTAFSGVGLLAQVMHAGNLYNRTPFADVAAEIIGTMFDYEVAQELADLEVIGWLPYDTARANLHRLLFESGAAIRKSEDGLIRFGFLSEAEPTVVPDGRVVFGGSVDYMAPATAAEITEHTFFRGDFDETVTLCDNTGQGADAADHSLVVFDVDGPVYDLAASQGLTINASGVNHAIVTGVGVLTGKKYSHAMRVVSKIDTTAQGLDNVKRVTDNCLVSILNSRNVAKRVLAYYSSAKTVRTRLLLKDERTGDCIQFSDPYGEATKGYLQEAGLSASTALFGDCEIIAGYKPTGQGNNISTVELLSEAQTWTVPAGVYEITLVLIGGGNGGYNGGRGNSTYGLYLSHSSDVAQNYSPGKGGKGGAGGLRGMGGKIYRTTISVTPGQTFVFTPGVGGDAGQEGTATTFGSYSSASGNSIEYGFVDIINSATYGKSGRDGVPGGKGGDGGQTTGTGESGGRGEGSGAITTGASGGSSRVLYWDNPLYGTRSPQTTAGGMGGGGTGEAIGTRGGSISSYDTWSESSRHGTFTVRANAGNGAAGASKPEKTTFGEGGDGGDGGGGGGGVGGYYNKPWSFRGETHSFDVRFTGGSGADGGAGGKGGPGCGLVYYGTQT